MQDFLNKKVVLGVSGGIAAYKAVMLVRALTQAGAEVRVVMTKAAKQFVTPLTFQALSGHAVRSELFDTEAEQAMGHIELARWADMIVIAPATANCLAKFAHGLADDLISTLVLVATVPVVVCPAMNQQMWLHPSVQDNCQKLRDHGVILVGPDDGVQACGEIGYGRLVEPDLIMDSLRLIHVKPWLLHQHVVINAGPTREPMDPVRYLSNRSSGKMGFALALAAKMAGANVTLISGPSFLVPPSLGIECVKVESAMAMHEAVQNALHDDSIFIACAAVSDYRFETISSQKIKKQKNETLTLTLVKNPDILAEVALQRRAAFVVGFAAETNDVLKHAMLKLQSKQLDMIIANHVGDGQGFECDDNQVTLITPHNQIDYERKHKVRLAGEIIMQIAQAKQEKEIK